MSNINYELEFLFGRWYERIIQNGGKNITKDGIMLQNDKSPEETVQMWIPSPKRVVFLLKDQNQGNDDKWDEDIRYWLKNVDWKDIEKKEKWNANAAANRNIKNRFIKNIAYILWGLAKADNNGRCYHEAENHHNEVKSFFNTQPFALVECKKEPGGSSLDENILRKHFDIYGDLLKEEIDILHPNIIVCCDGQGAIFDFVTNSYLKDKEYIPFGGQYVLDDGTDLHFETRLRYYPNNKVVVIDSFHPKARGKDNWIIFDRVLSPFRKFMASEYVSDFFK